MNTSSAAGANQKTHLGRKEVKTMKTVQAFSKAFKTGMVVLAVAASALLLCGQAGADYSAFIDAIGENSNRQLDAVNAWDYGAIRGTDTFTSPSGSTVQLPYSNPMYYQHPNGTFFGTPSYVPPDPWTSYTPYYPMW